jgi:hypothetical protein
MLWLPANAVEAIVLLSEQPVKQTSWVEVPGVQPLATPPHPTTASMPRQL